MIPRFLAHSFLLLSFWSTITTAQEWTRFRGPNGTGISHATTVPSQWTEKDLNWKINLPGRGHSSPVLWGDRLFITSAEENGSGGFHVLCFNATDGSKRWQRDLPLTPYTKSNNASFASSTPAVDADRLYLCCTTPKQVLLMALDHEGKTLWERDLGPYVSPHGYGTSPILYGDRVILSHEQDETSFLIAVDAKDGKTRWQTPRRNTKAAYSTPCVYQAANGKPQLIFNSQSYGISAIDPESGAELWHFEAFDKRSVSSPFFTDGLVFGSCGSGGGGIYLAAVRPADPATGAKAELAYKMDKSAPYVPTGIAVGDYAYLLSDQGVVSCMHMHTQEIRWQQKIGKGFFSSPVWVGGRLFCVSQRGELVVVAADPESFKELGRVELGEASNATPAIAGGRMFIRTETHLLSVGGEKK